MILLNILALKQIQIHNKNANINDVTHYHEQILDISFIHEDVENQKLYSIATSFITSQQDTKGQISICKTNKIDANCQNKSSFQFIYKNIYDWIKTQQEQLNSLYIYFQTTVSTEIMFSCAVAVVIANINEKKLVLHTSSDLHLLYIYCGAYNQLNINSTIKDLSIQYLDSSQKVITANYNGTYYVINQLDQNYHSWIFLNISKQITPNRFGLNFIDASSFKQLDTSIFLKVKKANLCAEKIYFNLDKYQNTKYMFYEISKFVANELVIITFLDRQTGEETTLKAWDGELKMQNIVVTLRYNENSTDNVDIAPMNSIEMIDAIYVVQLFYNQMTELQLTQEQNCDVSYFLKIQTTISDYQFKYYSTESIFSNIQQNNIMLLVYSDKQFTQSVTLSQFGSICVFEGPICAISNKYQDMENSVHFYQSLDKSANLKLGTQILVYLDLLSKITNDVDNKLYFQSDIPYYFAVHTSNFDFRQNYVILVKQKSIALDDVQDSNIYVFLSNEQYFPNAETTNFTFPLCKQKACYFNIAKELIQNRALYFSVTHSNDRQLNKTLLISVEQFQDTYNLNLNDIKNIRVETTIKTFYNITKNSPVINNLGYLFAQNEIIVHVANTTELQYCSLSFQNSILNNAVSYELSTQKEIQFPLPLNNLVADLIIAKQCRSKRYIDTHIDFNISAYYIFNEQFVKKIGSTFSILSPIFIHVQADLRVTHAIQFQFKGVQMNGTKIFIADKFIFDATYDIADVFSTTSNSILLTPELIARFGNTIKISVHIDVLFFVNTEIKWYDIITLAFNQEIMTRYNDSLLYLVNASQNQQNFSKINTYLNITNFLIIFDICPIIYDDFDDLMNNTNQLYDNTTFCTDQLYNLTNHSNKDLFIRQLAFKAQLKYYYTYQIQQNEILEFQLQGDVVFEYQILDQSKKLLIFAANSDFQLHENHSITVQDYKTFNLLLHIQELDCGKIPQRCDHQQALQYVAISNLRNITQVFAQFQVVNQTKSAKIMIQEVKDIQYLEVQRDIINLLTKTDTIFIVKTNNAEKLTFSTYNSAKTKIHYSLDGIQYNFIELSNQCNQVLYMQTQLSFKQDMFLKFEHDDISIRLDSGASFAPILSDPTIYYETNQIKIIDAKSYINEFVYVYKINGVIKCQTDELSCQTQLQQGDLIEVEIVNKSNASHVLNNYNQLTYSGNDVKFKESPYIKQAQQINSRQNKEKVGDIVGIVIGVVILIALVCAIVFLSINIERLRPRGKTWLNSKCVNMPNQNIDHKIAEQENNKKLVNEE